MNKTVVVYKSKYGSTKQYANWIAEALHADLFEASKITGKELGRYTTIIYGGGLYAGGIGGINLITKHFDEIKDKKIVVYTCGLADPNDMENIKGIHKGIDKIFTPEAKNKIEFFHLRGGIDYKKLGIVHKAMMAMLKHALSKKDFEALRDEDKQMLETYGKKVDFINKETITPLVEYCRG